MNSPSSNLWRTWQYAICMLWIVVSVIILFKPDYQRQIQHYGHGELYFPDTWNYSILLVLSYSIIPVTYLWASCIAWFRQHYILQWFMILSIHILFFGISTLGAIHNASHAYAYYLFSLLFGILFHIFIVPWIWWWINQSLQPKID